MKPLVGRPIRSRFLYARCLTARIPSLVPKAQTHDFFASSATTLRDPPCVSSPLSLRARLIFASTAAFNSCSAKAVGHIAPSSSFASCRKPNVAYLVLNFAALWKKQTTLPSLAYAGIPYQSLDKRSGVLDLTIAWIRSQRHDRVPASQRSSQARRFPLPLCSRLRLRPHPSSSQPSFRCSLRLPDFPPFSVPFVKCSSSSRKRPSRNVRTADDATAALLAMLRSKCWQPARASPSLAIYVSRHVRGKARG